ncbi:PQQ-like domain-containing protein, partial [Streptomyces sp. IgraMP-1]
GFAPWHKTVAGGRADIADELRCVGAGQGALRAGAAASSRPASTPATARASGRRRARASPCRAPPVVGATDDTVLGYRFAAEDAPEDPRSEVVALDAESGRELWSAPTGAQSTAVTGRNQDAVVSGSTVLMVDAANSRLEARDARSGEVSWATPFPSGTRCAPVPAGSHPLVDVRPRRGTRRVEGEPPRRAPARPRLREAGPAPRRQGPGRRGGRRGRRTRPPPGALGGPRHHRLRRDRPRGPGLPRGRLRPPEGHVRGDARDGGRHRPPERGDRADHRVRPRHRP